MNAKNVAIYQGENGPVALVTGEIQPCQRRTIARFDGVGVNFSQQDRQQWAERIVRAVNTFDQAREALKLALDYYRSKGTQKFNPYEVEQQLEKALAAMEAEHEL